jgi:alpha-glucosidase
MRYERGSANKVRNAISIEMNRSLAEAMEEYRPGTRPFIMSRSGYAGMQKYGASVWSGDTSCSFEQLSRQPALAQSMGLAGVPYWNSDIGGFNGTPSPELYLRWCQFGFLNPLYRPHGAQSNREPWRFGATVEDQVRDLLRLRYRLLPYYYTVSRQAYDTGAPIMRPLVMDWPGDPAVSNLGGQYLYGPLLMAAPVTAQGATSWDVYLPEGEWADWFTGARVVGPTTQHVNVGNGAFPLFVRCPGILPLGPVMNRSDAAPLDPVTLRVFFEDATEHAEGRLYEDDGLSDAYQAGACAWTDFHATRQPGDLLTVTVSAASGAFQGQLPARGYIVEIPVGAPPSAVWIDSQPLARLADSTGEPATGGWSYDSAAGLIRARADGLQTDTSHTLSVNALTAFEGWQLY